MIEIIGDKPLTIYQACATFDEGLNEIILSEWYYTSEQWKQLTLLNGAVGFSTKSPLYHDPHYRKENNRVYLRGLFTGGKATQNIAQLPEGYRPAKSRIFLATTAYKNQSSIVARLDISKDGYMVIGTYGTAYDIEWVSLDGISFATD